MFHARDVRLLQKNQSHFAWHSNPASCNGVQTKMSQNAVWGAQTEESPQNSPLSAAVMTASVSTNRQNKTLGVKSLSSLGLKNDLVQSLVSSRLKGDAPPRPIMRRPRSADHLIDARRHSSSVRRPGGRRIYKQQSFGSNSLLSLHQGNQSLSNIVEELVNPVDGHVVEIQGIPVDSDSHSSRTSGGMSRSGSQRSLGCRSKGSRDMPRAPKRHLRRGGSICSLTRSHSRDRQRSSSQKGRRDKDIMVERGDMNMVDFNDSMSTLGLDDLHDANDSTNDLEKLHQGEHPSFSDLSAGSRDSAPKLRPRKHHIKAFVNTVRKIHDKPKLRRCNSLDVMATEHAWALSRTENGLCDSSKPEFPYHVRTGKSITIIRSEMMDNSDDKDLQQMLSSEYSEFGMGISNAEAPNGEDLVYLCHVFRS